MNMIYVISAQINIDLGFIFLDEHRSMLCLDEWTSIYVLSS